jgi:hypothetical protein
MSVVHAAATVAATVTPLPTPVVTPTPSPSPTVEAVAHAANQVVQSHPGLLDVLNVLASSIGQPEIIAAGAAAAVALQALLNKLPWLQHEVQWIEDLRRRFVAIVLPVLGTALTSFASGHNELHLAPAVFLLGQVGFWTFSTWRKVRSDRTEKAPAVESLAAPTGQDPAQGIG